MICEKFAAQGANIVVNYVSSQDRAEQVAEKARGYGVKAVCIQAVSLSAPCFRKAERTLFDICTVGVVHEETREE